MRRMEPVSRLELHDHTAVHHEIGSEVPQQVPLEVDRQHPLGNVGNAASGEHHLHGPMVYRLEESPPEPVVHLAECSDDLVREIPVEQLDRAFLAF